MANRVRVDGLRELERALSELPKTTGKNVLKRTLIKAAEPVERDAKARAPVRYGALRDIIATSTKVNKHNASAIRKSGSKSYSEVHVGVESGKTATGERAFAQIAGIATEFGNAHQAAEPWFRPAWDSTQDQALDIIKDELGSEIEKAATRLARKAARQARRAK